MDKIICIGKNYFEHALELKEPLPENPVVFFKPPSTLLNYSHSKNAQECPLFWKNGNPHFECELVFKVSGGGFQLSEKQAQECLKHVSVGLDLTLREKQKELKNQGLPWEMSKSFFHSCVVGPWIPVEWNNDFLEKKFSLHVNQELKQKSCIQKMRFSPAFCLSYVSSFIPVCDGDLLYTGTPEGVAALQPGDHAHLQFESVSYSLHFL